MSQQLDKLRPGDFLELKGPVGEIEYVGRGAFRIHGAAQLRSVRRLAMVAGGSGITPMFQARRTASRRSANRQLARAVKAPRP